MSIPINLPDVLSEVTAAFERYELAISAYDAASMNELFWDSPHTLRYGPNGTLVGHAAIAAFRNAKQGKGVKRTLRNTLITTFGSDFAIVNTEGVTDKQIQRQSQTWVRTELGWKIVSAHVSGEAL